jgi:hypothetical protein
MGTLVKVSVPFLDTLPDILERKVSRGRIDALREELYLRFTDQGAQVVRPRLKLARSSPRVPGVLAPKGSAS